ncbi:YihY family inner membrane protein [Candidatus Ornithobacterium hominis]|uniref:YihY/virulence factor BrkB family protein n=1 Tax=Candidatus Ornithobacterium hominis TaxID=2497989 RepID=UPI0024BC6362|nr:YihY/virulence factor BrkB family protein [Candidatus Ornithobacterium hominis]CAI9430002.1 YihY family inner membrane protein [Candidatus Ornithobacterium hominis]
MKQFLLKCWEVIRRTFLVWFENDPFRQSAIISYYAILSLPGLLIMIIWTLGQFYGEKAMQGQVVEKIQNMMGLKSAEFIENLIQNAYLDPYSEWYVQVIGIGTLIFSATTLFFQIQQTLNHQWNVEVKPNSGILHLITVRLNGMMLILIITLLLLITVISSSVLSSFKDSLEFYIGGEWTLLLNIGDIVLSFVVICVLFSLVYKFLPDVEIPWKMVWIGGLVTTLLFNLGKYLLSYYFSVADPSSGFGTASIIIFIMIWINYTTLILLFGATFTYVYGLENNYKIRPNKYAQWNKDYVLRHKNAVLNKLFEDKEEELLMLDENIRQGVYRDPEVGESSKTYIDEIGIKKSSSIFSTVKSKLKKLGTWRKEK